MMQPHNRHQRLVLCGMLLLLAATNVALSDETASPGTDQTTRKKIVFVAGRPSHGYGAHEHHAGCLLLAHYLRDQMPDYETVVYQNGWPQQGLSAFDGADAVVVYCDGGGGHLLMPHLEEFDQIMKRGVGAAFLHYGVEVPKGDAGNAFTDWIGGYFETNWSVNPHWTADFQQFPDHPVTRGVQPFAINDEWYFHMRFRPEMQGVTPILSAHPPESTMSRPDGEHSGNPHVRAAMQRGEIQHVAWACDRPDGGRGFGFTGGHSHWNWGDDNFRKIVLNAIVWVAKGEVPADGVGGVSPTREQLEQNQDYPKPSERKSARRRPRTDSDTQTVFVSEHSPESAIDNLDVHPDLQASLFAAEPQLLSPANIDVDHRGRVWVCEIVNYRGHNGKRPEGDRILILEDTDGDGTADSEKVFYQGNDLISPHGVCVLGHRVIVSVGSQVLCFVDEDGDDRPERKELWFSGIEGVQHDHGIHAFMFGPDGKLYFNFGNEGKRLLDADGQPIVDLAGNVVNHNRQPYQEGMVFRCNLDRSEFETLGWNFRNNWMVTVDSFGSIWQSDNDDDGNRGVRINYVMEFGNYGYRDEMTGAGWSTPRTGMEEEIPLRHWHLNDPGVVPNLLQTGGGSPTGIAVYEGTALPAAFHGNLIHCDAGPSVTRAYLLSDDGAGYRAEIVDILQGARDQWFRPSDVKVAPDGSLIVADWYDPGVGGHRMGDLERGRIFRVTAKSAAAGYEVPTFNFDTIDGAIEALKNPNLSARYLAWQSLHQFGTQAEPGLVALLQSSNPVYQARALWLLGKIPGRGQHYVDVALNSADPRLRMLALRLARQLPEVDQIDVVQKLVRDDSPQVRRECAIALRHSRDPRMASLWTQLATQYDGADRWYLEAMGIAADGQWDACLDAWRAEVGDQWVSAAGREIVWRSRATETPRLLQKLIQNRNVPDAMLPRLFRSLDFVPGTVCNEVLLELAFVPGNDPRDQYISSEALARLQPSLINGDAARRAKLITVLDRLNSTERFIELIGRFGLDERYDELIRLSRKHHAESLGVSAVQVLLNAGQESRLRDAIQMLDDLEADQLVAVLGSSADNRAVAVIEPLLEDVKRSEEARRNVLRSMARIRAGAEKLVARAESNQLPAELVATAASELNRAPWADLRDRAEKLFPLAPSKDNQPLPSIRDLAQHRGDVKAGREVFVTTGTCVKCHVVGGDGKQVGPELSEVGGKLSREALFESILFPSAGISHSYETFIVELTDGNVLTGLLVSQTDDEIQLKDNEAVIRRVPRESIELIAKQPVSLMPADLHQLITEDELVNLVEYLTTLKKTTSPM